MITARRDRGRRCEAVEGVLRGAIYFSGGPPVVDGGTLALLIGADRRARPLMAARMIEAVRRGRLFKVELAFK